MDNTTEKMIRMAKLSGIQIDVKNLEPVECDPVELTEQEWKDVAMDRKIVLNDKKHILAFQNKFVLKPVTVKTDDKGKAETNKISDYEKDGGDAKKVNKKMLDNDKHGGTSMVKEQRTVGPVTDDQREAGKMVYDHLTYGKKKYGYGEQQKTAKEKEEEEYQELMRKKKEKKDPDSFIKSIFLKNATIGEAYENRQEFDYTDADEYYGLDSQRKNALKIPRQLISSINSKIKEIGASIAHYDEKGYNDGDGDNSNKIKAMDALEQIKSNLSLKTEEGLKQAQLFFLTLMSPITDLFPADVVVFLANGNLETPTDSKKLSDVEPFETKLKESFENKNFMFTNQKRFNQFFEQQILPTSDVKDESSYRKMYADYVDTFVREGYLPKYAVDWIPPEISSLSIRESEQKRTILDILSERKKSKKRVTENTGVTDFTFNSDGIGNRKELLAKYARTKKPEDAVAARKAGATQSELKKARDAKVED